MSKVGLVAGLVAVAGCIAGGVALLGKRGKEDCKVSPILQKIRILAIMIDLPGRKIQKNAFLDARDDLNRALSAAYKGKSTTVPLIFSSLKEMNYFKDTAANVLKNWPPIEVVTEAQFKVETEVNLSTPIQGCDKFHVYVLHANDGTSGVKILEPELVEFLSKPIT